MPCIPDVGLTKRSNPFRESEVLPFHEILAPTWSSLAVASSGINSRIASGTPFRDSMLVPLTGV